MARFTLLIWAYLSTDKNDVKVNDYEIVSNSKALTRDFAELSYEGPKTNW